MHVLHGHVVIATILSLPTATQAQRVVLDTARVEAALTEEMRTMRAPGVAIAVVIGDRIAYAKGFGVAA